MMSADVPVRQPAFRLPTSRVLTAPSDVADFVDGHNRVAGRQLYTAESFAGMLIRGFYVGERMVAGYAINVTPPYFYVGLIPPAVRATLPLLQDDPTFAEIRGLWIDRSTPNYLRAQVYVRLIVECAAQRPDYTMGGTVIRAAWLAQRQVIPRPLWEGPVEAWGEQHHAWLFYGRPAECVLRLFYAIPRGWLARIKARR